MDQRNEKQRQEERELEREVLLLLRALKKPIKWPALYAQFNNHGTGDIGRVLDTLKDGRYIAVDGEQRVTITDIGLKRLAAGMF